MCGHAGSEGRGQTALKTYDVPCMAKDWRLSIFHGAWRGGNRRNLVPLRPKSWFHHPAGHDFKPTKINIRACPGAGPVNPWADAIFFAVPISRNDAACESLTRDSATDSGRQWSVALDQWACGQGVTLDFSRPGKPTDHALIESFNGSLRDECLNAH